MSRTGERQRARTRIGSSSAPSRSEEETIVRRTLALIAATAAVGGAAALAAAAPSNLSLTTQQTSQKAVFTSTEDVFQGGKKVGTDRVTCTASSETKASCRVTVTLPKGTI